MVGFEDDGPTPAVVTAGGVLIEQDGRPDGGPPTERVEVEPVKLRAFRASRRGCGSLTAAALMAEIYFHASRLEPLMDEYHGGEPWTFCECEDCRMTNMSCEFMGYLAYQVRLVKDEAKQMLLPDVWRAVDARAAAAEGQYGFRDAIARHLQDVHFLAKADGVPAGVRDELHVTVRTLAELCAG